jgi:hypothetical protein
MIKDLFFIAGLQPDFAKSSGDDPPLFSTLPMDDDCHFCCKPKFLKKILSQMMTPCEFGFWPWFFVK